MKTTPEIKQSIGLVGIQNARELGGSPASDGRRVRRGVLLRSAKPSTGTPEDFRRLTEVYHLSKVIDLRSDQELNGSPELAPFTHTTEPDPDPVIGTAENIHIPILDLEAMMEQNAAAFEADASGAAQMDIIKILEMSIKAGFISDELYFGFLDNNMGKEGYSRLFRELLNLEEGTSLLFHCTQGKDRTGVAAMLILSALCVPEDIIVSDYLLTNELNRERIIRERQMLEMSGKVPAGQLDTYLMAMDKVNEKTMTNVIAHIRERCGSVEGYIINELGITQSELNVLRGKYLTEV